MIPYFLLGATLAFSAAVQPGPFQAYLVSSTMAGGWRRTMPAAFAPLLSDIPIVALVLLLLTRIPPLWLDVLRVAGGAFLLYLAARAFSAFRGYRREIASTGLAPRDHSGHGAGLRRSELRVRGAGLRAGEAATAHAPRSRRRQPPEPQSVHQLVHRPRPAGDPGMARGAFARGRPRLRVLHDDGRRNDRAGAAAGGCAFARTAHRPCARRVSRRSRWPASGRTSCGRAVREFSAARDEADLTGARRGTPALTTGAARSIFIRSFDTNV